MEYVTLLAKILPFFAIGFAGLWVWWSSRSDKKIKVREIIQKFSNKEKEDEIKSLQVDKIKVIANIENLNKMSIEKKKEIRKITDDAAIKINEISKLTTVSDVNDILDNDDY